MKIAPSLRALAALRDQVSLRPFTCRSCAVKRPVFDVSRQQRSPSSWLPSLARGSRSASQVAPVTTVDAKKHIPTEFRELYNQLSSLGQFGSAYVNASQLQLALRGLESRNSVIRIGVLGVSGGSGAEKLIRALLADPLAAKAEWEDLVGNGPDSRALLIRYGDAVRYDDHHPLLRTLTIPSTFLDRQQLEFLIHETSIVTRTSSVSFYESMMEILVPILETPSSQSGRVSKVTYPVHRSVLYGEGLNHLGTISHIMSGMTREYRDIVFGVANVTWQQIDDDESAPNVSLVNTNEGEEAIKNLRESLNNSSKFEYRWLDSNLSSVMSFFASGDNGERKTMKPALEDLISLLVSHTERAMSVEESLELENVHDKTITSEVRRSLASAITYWAELAHTELRDELEDAFHSRSWRKLIWWKLPWRVDDIGMITSEALQRAYLVEAEKGIIWVSGRLQEAGLMVPFGPKLKEPEKSSLLYVEVPDHKIHDILPEITSKPHDYLSAIRPWPLQIAASRATLLQESLPPLQAVAQRLLLETLSTTSLGFTISLLIYLSLSTTSIYESGAIASLALAWSARRLQMRWEDAKRGWMDKVILEGKHVLDAVERSCRTILEEGGRPKGDLTAVDERNRVKEIVERVKKALHEAA